MDHHLGLGDLGRAHAAHGAAAANLPVGQGRGLVVLAMGAKVAGLPGVIVGHDVHVVVDGVHVQYQAGGVKLLDWGARLGPVVLVHGLPLLMFLGVSGDKPRSHRGLLFLSLPLSHGATETHRSP